jgi:hypothetical protein
MSAFSCVSGPRSHSPWKMPSRLPTCWKSDWVNGLAFSLDPKCPLRRYGLSATWVLDGICLSLCSHDMWNRSQLAVEVSLFSDGEISAELETIRHVSHPDHFRDHEGWLQREQESSIRNGADLVAQASAMYPNVELGLDARKELAALSGAERHFGWVIECLEAANREIRAGTNGPFPHKHLPWSRKRRERKRSPFPGKNENARVRLAHRRAYPVLMRALALTQFDENVRQYVVAPLHAGVCAKPHKQYHRQRLRPPR